VGQGRRHPLRGRLARGRPAARLSRFRRSNRAPEPGVGTIRGWVLADRGNWIGLPAVERGDTGGGRDVIEPEAVPPAPRARRHRRVVLAGVTLLAVVAGGIAVATDGTRPEAK